MEEITDTILADKEKEQDISKEDTELTNPLNKGEPVVLEKDLKGGVVNESVKKKPHRFQKGQSGNPKGRPKNKPFSLKSDILKSLKRIKKKKPELYEEIIDSYWKDPKKREFLLEIIDGKARQSMEFAGSLENPVRIIEVKQAEEAPKEDLSRANK